MGADMMKEWSKVWEEEGQMNGMFGAPQTRTIQFSQENKFMEQPDVDLMEKARALIE